MKTSPLWIGALQHLRRYSVADYVVTASFEATQLGIGSSVGISRAHAALLLTDLVKRQLVETRLLHIKGNGRRRKAYFVTHLGWAALRELGVAS